ncbi:MAG: hypothetical protein HYZ09_03890 [Candidatus Kerfeldbacteria bacterium]|nr:hypothetical protein [Candidatus Kerfeldbacteria bacterium]
MRWINVLHAYQPPDWDPAVIRKVSRECYRPMTDFLVAHPTVKVTLNLAGSLTEQLVALGEDRVLQNIATLVARGQVELMTMPKYHPLIPFVSRDELEAQLLANAEVNRARFGDAYRPAGLFPPELAINNDLGATAEAFGLRWIVLDELAYNGTLGAIDPRRACVWNGTNVRVVFRDRRVSDFFAFRVTADEVRGFANIAQQLGVETDTILTAMDFENLGHHRPGAAPAWQRLATQPDVETLTVSEHLDFPGDRDEVTPIASSWSTDDHDLAKGIPYPLWQHPDNPVHTAIHALADRTRELVLAHRDHPGYTEARHRLDRAQASDVYWWASMRPWWDAPIVLRESREFLHVVEPLSLTDRELTALWERVRQLTNKWERTGQAKTARQAYLADHRPDVFFAGQHIER